MIKLFTLGAVMGTAVLVTSCGGGVGMRSAGSPHITLKQTVKGNHGLGLGVATNTTPSKKDRQTATSAITNNFNISITADQAAGKTIDAAKVAAAAAVAGNNADNSGDADLATKVIPDTPADIEARLLRDLAPEPEKETPAPTPPAALPEEEPAPAPPEPESPPE
jgi:hypothetical protein